MSADMGAPAIDVRIVIGAMIIKHKLKLDDRETIETIRETFTSNNFLGLKEYTYEDVFERSLFTTLRYRLGADKFDAITRQIILRSEGKGDKADNDLMIRTIWIIGLKKQTYQKMKDQREQLLKKNREGTKVS